MRYWQIWFPVRAHSLARRQQPSHCPCVIDTVSPGASLPVRTLLPSWRPILLASSEPIIAQSFHLQMPSHRGLGVHTSLGGQRHSVCNTTATNLPSISLNSGLTTAAKDTFYSYHLPTPSMCGRWLVSPKPHFSRGTTSCPYSDSGKTYRVCIPAHWLCPWEAIGWKMLIVVLLFELAQVASAVQGKELAPWWAIE